jgi:type II secretory pathway component PulF
VSGDPGGEPGKPAFQKTLTGVRTTVEGGATLANAMRQYPKSSTTSPPT